VAINHFIPEVWSASLLTSLKKALIYAQPNIVNRDYEGDIANAGDTVRITSISRPTISDYVPGVTSITPEPLTDTQRTLVIDQSKYFAFEVDDVDARQAMGNVLSEGMREAAFALAELADRFVAGLYTGVQAANNLGTVAVTTGDLAYTQLVQLASRLHTANVPDDMRWVVIPPWYHALLLENTKFTDQSASGQPSAAVNGSVGRVAGMEILMSNNVPNPTGDDYAVIAGTRSAITYAEQINKTEAYRPESSFSDAVKGLHLYGGKLIRPDGIAVVTASQT
jgi:N4-gp56 family major capsid protein